MINYEVDVIPYIGKFFVVLYIPLQPYKSKAPTLVIYYENAPCIDIKLQCNIDIALEIACYWASQLEMD